MNRMSVFLGALAVGCGVLSPAANAQSIDVMGARAAGMGGAFVGVADDASAIYWNPGGLAAGAYFSLVLDGGTERAIPDQSLRGRRQSSFLLGLAMPALGLTYYRLQRSVAAPYALLEPAGAAISPPTLTGALPVRVDSLVTHHAGITLMQSLSDNVAVGTTLKLVRGIAASEALGFVTADVALDHEGVRGRATNKFDFDVGAMATYGSLKAGLTIRNMREPEFETPEGERALRLDRQARAGVSYALTPNWLVAADLDLLETQDALGDRRDVALGVEGRPVRRLTVRSGLRLNAAGSGDDSEIAPAHAFALGGSFAATAAVLIDGAAILGGDRGGRGWRVAARFVY
jgi:hypothetical protein